MSRLSARALAGEPVTHQGEFFRLSRFRLGAPPVQQQLPIYLASLGPKNLELTGQVADGWLPVWIDHRRLPELKQKVAQAASNVGRHVSQVTVAPQIVCYVADSPDELAEGERLMRAHMAYYIGGMGNYYYDLFRRMGYRTEADAIKDAWASRERGKARRCHLRRYAGKHRDPRKRGHMPSQARTLPVQRS